MISNLGLKYIEMVYSWLSKSEKRVIIIVFCFSYAIFLSDFITQFKIAILLLLISATFIFRKTKNWFEAFFYIFLLTLPLFKPQKYYVWEAIKASEIIASNNSDGYSIGYGVNLSNVFLVILIFFLITQFKKKWNLIKQKSFFDSKIKLLLISLLGFLFSTTISSFYFSPAPLLSLIWSLQFSQQWFVGFSFFFFLKYYGDKKKYFFIILSLSILFQGIISFLQFFKQSYIGLAIENGSGDYFFRGSDEIASLFRVSGTFFHYNQFPFIMNILLCCILPIFLKRRQPLFLLTVLIIILVDILSQSRMNWLILSVILVTSCKFYWNECNNLIKKLWQTKRIYYFFLSVCLLSWIIFPRLFLTRNSFGSEGSLNLRYKMIVEGFSVFIDSPWFGYGAGTNEYILHKVFPEGVTASFLAPIHFAPLQLLNEIGVFGFTFFILPYLFITRKLIATGRATNNDSGFIFHMGMIVTLLYYTVQPHMGIIEFSYLGLILGFGLEALDRTG